MEYETVFEVLKVEKAVFFLLGESLVFCSRTFSQVIYYYYTSFVDFLCYFHHDTY